MKKGPSIYFSQTMMIIRQCLQLVVQFTVILEINTVLVQARFIVFLFFWSIIMINGSASWVCLSENGEQMLSRNIKCSLSGTFPTFPVIMPLVECYLIHELHSDIVVVQSMIKSHFMTLTSQPHCIQLLPEFYQSFQTFPEFFRRLKFCAIGPRCSWLLRTTTAEYPNFAAKNIHVSCFSSICSM